MNPFSFIKAIVEILFELTSLLVFSIYIFSAKFFRLFISRPLKSLDGEIILITGTGNGIGKQLALQLAEVAPKAKFICWDNEVKSNEETVAEMKEKNVEAHAYQIDISDRQLVSKLASKVRNEVGDVTIIFNNAGIVQTGPFLLQKPESSEKTFEVNLFAHFWILSEFLPSMIRHNHGHIITTASLSAALPCRDIATYAACKHAVHGFIDSLKRELRVHPSKPNNIHFTTVYPGMVQTRMIESAKLSPRFPALFLPFVSPQYIARKTIEGFRQNYEYLYLPPMAQLIAFCSALLPFEIQQKLEHGLFQCEVEHLSLSKEELNDYRSTGLEHENGQNSKTL